MAYGKRMAGGRYGSGAGSNSTTKLPSREEKRAMDAKAEQERVGRMSPTSRKIYEKAKREGDTKTLERMKALDAEKRKK